MSVVIAMSRLYAHRFWPPPVDPRLLNVLQTRDIGLTTKLGLRWGSVLIISRVVNVSAPGDPMGYFPGKERARGVQLAGPPPPTSPELTKS